MFDIPEPPNGKNNGLIMIIWFIFVTLIITMFIASLN